MTTTEKHAGPVGFADQIPHRLAAQARHLPVL